MNRNLYFVLATLTLLSLTQLAGCGFSKPEQLQMISPTELNALLNQGDILLIDVHIPEQRHIAGTDAVVPFHQIEDNLDQFPADKNTPVYLYCKSGPMGNWAADTLIELGYQQVYNLEGGMDAWNELNLPVESSRPD